MKIHIRIPATALAERKTCKKGKPCGNTCIAQSKVCRKNLGLFGGAPKVRGNRAARAALKQLFGRDLTAQEIGGLAGAPQNGSVEIKSSAPFTAVDLEVRGPHIGAQTRSVSRGADGRPEIYNAFFIAKASAPDGYGTHALIHQAKTAQRLGVSRISLVAAGHQGSSYVGYYAWPRMGFDAQLGPTMISRAASAGFLATKVSDLMATPASRAWWRDHGQGFSGEFDLSHNSPHFKRLENYSKEKGYDF